MTKARYWLLVLGLVACRDNYERSSERFTSVADGFSVAKIEDGWTMSRDRGAIMFTGSGERARHTIVIRTVPKPTQLAENVPSTLENVSEATKRALGALPGAKLERTWRVEKSELPAVETELTFTPNVAHGKRYQRRHAVIVAAGHILHVIYTAPAGETIDDELFDTMVRTIEEAV